MTTLTQLYPQQQSDITLEGLYLSHNIRSLATNQPFVYSNYVTSLDGRIAVPHPTKPGLVVPKNVANARDWRLFQELAVQADILISSGRYLRDYADGRAQEILQVYDDARFQDLQTWRTEHGLSPQPDIVVISASLEFPVPPELVAGSRTVIVITPDTSNQQKQADLQTQGVKVITVPERVTGTTLVAALQAEGYQYIYNATGPKVLHLLLADNMLDRLYLTQVNRLLGGDPYSGIVEGPLLDPPVDMPLNTIYFDPVDVGQLFLSYNKA